jgi:hypothetical protein
MQRPDTLSAVHDFGGDPAAVLERVKDPAFVQQLRPDWSRVEVEEFCRSGLEPPGKVGIVNDAGKLVRPLVDDQPIGPHEAFANRAELRRGVRQFRAAQAEQQQQLLNELAAAQEQQQTPGEQAPQIPLHHPRALPQSDLCLRPALARCEVGCDRHL